ncbi:HEAT repeat domain-containing protein [Allocoleopsis sp.]|uniref:HEAT repeat domain-containing protein n=1 Tax=Allocoleopsis sp. TaxID=3088169 RepID=UPI002FD1E9CF
MSRSIRVAPECLPKVRQALRLHGFPSQHALAIEIGLSRATITSFFTGKRVDYLNFVEISEKLGLDWHAIAYIEKDPPIQVESAPPSDTPPEAELEKKNLGIDWRQICRDMLEAQNLGRLTTNPLTAGDGAAFELDEIYVPLGLVERKKRDRRSGDVTPEQGSQLYVGTDLVSAQDEIIKTFHQDEFFEQVLRLGRSRRIAIIGEPGAGKSTLLQKITAWVLDNTEDVPIWISLADLQGKSLKAYLLEDWLENATRRVHVSEEMQKTLGELFNSGRVWLLLDAVDEMAVGVTTGGLPLQLIANQITGWVADARVVLTCRLNVWDAGKNALEAFETYRNLDFSYGDAQTPDQVGQFIKRWFKSKPQLPERLRAELEQPGKERIKDAVKNPLRLALLCRTWTLGQGGLPNTKAGLYQQFTAALYEWKQDRFPTSSTQRQELNKALGELAKRAIASEKTKFRLRHRLVCEVLGEPDSDLYRLALQLGWLNQVGVAVEAENRGEKVYAFYHSTFQEYFAAQVIDDWHYFLNHIPHNPVQGTYRIFDPSWKEVILLWLGREDVPKEHKEALIKALVMFQDVGKIFYSYRAYFLAAAGISEFRDCRWADVIVAQLIRWGYGYFDNKKQAWQTFVDPDAEATRAALRETDRRRAIATLVQLIESTENESTRRVAANSLVEIGTGHETAITALLQLLTSTQEGEMRWQAADTLGKIHPGNETAIVALVQLIESTENEFTLRKAVSSLGQIGTGNEIAIVALVQLIEFTENEFTRMQAIDSLGKIGIGNETAIAALVQLLKSTQDEDTRWQAADSIGKISPGNETAIAVLVQLLESTENESTQWLAAYGLGKIDPGNETTIAVLVQLLKSTKDGDICKRAAYSLKEIDPDNQTAVPAFVQLLESSEDRFTRRRAIYSLGKIGTGNKIAIAALVQLLESTKGESTRGLVALSLGTIDPGNETAVTALVQLLESTKNGAIRSRAASGLGQIGTGHETAITALVQLLEFTEDKYTRRRAAYSLGQIGIGNETAIAALMRLIESSEDEATRAQATYSLGQIATGNETAIAALVRTIKSTVKESILRQAVKSLKKILQEDHLAEIVTLLKDYLSNDTRNDDFWRYSSAYEVIWQCAQNMSYPEFYQAWHTQLTLIHPEILETTPVGSTSFTQSLNFANLPHSLRVAIANDPTVSQTIHLICIDGSKFIDRDNPASKIYTEMVKSDCPKCKDGTPKTMLELQIYWDLLDTDKRVVLVFYEGRGFSETFLNALSKFDGAICVITPQIIDNISLQCISPNEAIADVVDWLKKVVLEA